MNPFRTLLILMAVGLALGGYIFFFERNPVVKKEDTVKKVEVVPGFVADDIQKIQVEYLGTTQAALKATLVMEKDPKGSWNISAPDHFKADDALVRTVLAGIGDYTPDATVENPKNLADYGLEKPVDRCSFFPKSGKPFVLLVGDPGVGGASIYLKTADKASVYLLPTYGVELIRKKVVEFRDHGFFTADPVTTKKIEITHDGKSVVFERSLDNGWHMVKPFSSKVEDSKIKEILTAVTNLRMVDFVEDHPANLKIYGLDPPRAKIEVWPSDGSAPKAVLLGRLKLKTQNYFVKESDHPTVGLVASFFDKTLDLKLADFRDRSMMQFDASKAKTIAVSRNGKTYLYQKDEKGVWASEGRANGPTEALNLLSGLATLRVDDFVTGKAKTGITAASPQVVVGMEDGTKRTYHFGDRLKDQVYLASDKTKETYLVAAIVANQMDSFYNTMMTPVAVVPTPVKPTK